MAHHPTRYARLLSGGRSFRLGLLLMLGLWLGVSPVAHASLDIDYPTNYIVWFGGTCSANGGSSTTAQLAGTNNVEKLLNYLQGKGGLSLEQATGIVGAMQSESSAALDPSITNPHGGAYGIAQWLGDRKQNVINLGGEGNFDKQVYYLGIELGIEEPPAGSGITAGSEKGSLAAVKDTNTPEAAALAWEDKFERSGGAALEDRQANARKLYTNYSAGGTGIGAMSATTSTSTGGASCAAGSATGAVNADGYAFPIALGKSEVTNGYKWPCPGKCHHDGTDAFDLSKNARDDSTENTPTIAIYNGTIKSFNNAYANITGCQSFQLVGDDGWWYWYGHQQNSSIQDGAKVRAGQQISTVGRRACTGNSSYPHLHIDRGSPKGHYGGEVCCRDSDFTPLINKLYDELGGVPSVI